MLWNVHSTVSKSSQNIPFSQYMDVHNFIIIIIIIGIIS